MASGTQRMVWSHMESPVGLITLLANQRGLIYLDFCKQNDPVLGARIWLNHWFRHYTLEKNEQALLPYMDEIDEYFQGNTGRHLRSRLTCTEPRFQKRVWRQLPPFLTAKSGRIKRSRPPSGRRKQCGQWAGQQ